MALAKRLKLNLRSRKARLGWQCLQMYGLAKGLIRDGRDPDLAARGDARPRPGAAGRPRKWRREVTPAAHPAAPSEVEGQLNVNTAQARSAVHVRSPVGTRNADAKVALDFARATGPPA
jgi:hypothetical protein